jgi:hypothetical protein
VVFILPEFHMKSILEKYVTPRKAIGCCHDRLRMREAARDLQFDDSFSAAYFPHENVK